MDTFFAQKYCDRCGDSLENCRTMSILNTDCICMKCSEKEKQDEDYEKAVNAENEEIKKGNYNYKGIRGK